MNNETKYNIEELLPGARLIKLKGYTNGNTEYSKAKAPADAWKNSKSLTEEQVKDWEAKGGWIGAVIPEGRIVIDIDDSDLGALLRDLLEGERINHHSIVTPNGWQFIFESSSVETKKINQVSNYINYLGIPSDTRVSKRGYIVFPNANTEERQIVTRSLDDVDELPSFLHLAWNGGKTESPMAYPYEGEGSRDQSFYDLARRLFSCHVPYERVKEALHLAYEYLVPYKEDFPKSDIDVKVSSAYKTVHDGEELSAAEDEFTLLPVDSDEGDKPEKVSTESIPYPFSIGRNQTLFFNKERADGSIDSKFVCRQVPFLTKEFHNIEQPEVYYELKWNDFGRINREIIPGSVIATKRELVELSNLGLGVNDNNAKDLIQFMDRYLMENEIPKHYAVDRLGKVKDRFVHPHLIDDVEIMAMDYGEKQVLEGMKVSGDADTWKQEVLNRVKHHPKALFMVLASFASVLLEDLRLPPFIVDLSGTTSQGKTTLLKAAASVWGDGNLINEWNATAVSIERKAAFLNSFPLLMDDTRKTDERRLKSIIYQFSGGRSKGRGSVKGSQKEYRWNNIMLSTGEVTLNEYADNAGGAAARIIPLVDQPLPKDTESIERLQEALDEQYGVIGIQFLKEWEKHKSELIPEYYNFKKHYVTLSRGNEVLSRLASYYAAVHFAGSVLNKFLNTEMDLKLLDDLFQEMSEENEAIDKPMQFLEDILTELDSMRQSVYYDREPQVIHAIYKDTQRQLYLKPSFVKQMLGAEAKGTRKEWMKRKISIPNKEGRKITDTWRVDHKGKSFRPIPINMDVVESLGFDFYKKPGEDFY